ALKIVKEIHLLIGLLMFASSLHIEQLALASTDDLIRRFNLIQQCFDFSQCFAASQAPRVRSNNATCSGKFIRKLAREKSVIRAGLRDYFLIRLNCVQCSEPALECQTPSKAELIQPGHGLRQREIETCHNLERLLRASYFGKQKAGKPDR